MRISIDGQHVLGCVQGIYLDGRQVVPTGGQARGGGDFQTGVIEWYGGWNGPQPGHYTALMSNPVPKYIGEYHWQTNTAFFSDGRLRWLADYIDGARDSDDNYWPDRSALGASRQGDWIFVQKPGFNVIIVRHANGSEVSYNGGATDVCMDQGVLLFGLAGQPPQSPGYAPPRIPALMPFCTLPDGTRVLAGHASGGRLCIADWNATPVGYLLSGDGHDYHPAVAYRPADGMVVVASGENEGETVARVYVVDWPGKRYRLNDSDWRGLTTVDLLVAPPVPVPVPPDPIPVPPEPTPVPPTPIPVPPVPPDPPTPTPIGVVMRSDLKIDTSPSLTGLTELPHPAGQGLIGLQTAAGKFKSFKDGSWQPDASAMGPWEAFVSYGGVYLAARNGGADQGKTYIVGSRLPDVVPAP